MTENRIQEAQTKLRGAATYVVELVALLALYHLWGHFQKPWWGLPAIVAAAGFVITTRGGIFEFLVGFFAMVAAVGMVIVHFL